MFHFFLSRCQTAADCAFVPFCLFQACGSFLFFGKSFCLPLSASGTTTTTTTAMTTATARGRCRRQPPRNLVLCGFGRRLRTPELFPFEDPVNFAASPAVPPARLSHTFPLSLSGDVATQTHFNDAWTLSGAASASLCSTPPPSSVLVVFPPAAVQFC